MNKKLAALCQSYGMTVSGDSARGVLRGYEIGFVWRKYDMQRPVRLYVSFYGTEEQKRAVETAVRKLAIPYSVVSLSSYGLVIGMNDAFTVGRLVKRLPSVVDGVLGILEAEGVSGSGHCPFSADNHSRTAVFFNKRTGLLINVCTDRVIRQSNH